MPDNGEQVTGSSPYMPRSPDPTAASAAAVERATEVARREITALRETLETRLNGADQDRERLWDRLREIPQLYEAATGHLRDELLGVASHNREVLTQRLNDLDIAARVAAEHIERIPVDNQRDSAALAADFRNSLATQREIIETRLDGSDQQRALLWEELKNRQSHMDAQLERRRREFLDDLGSAREMLAQRISSEREYLLGQIELVSGHQGTLANRIDGIANTLQTELGRPSAALRAVIEARLDAADKAAEQQRSETTGQITSLRELLGSRIDGMDEATKLLAENVRSVKRDIEASAAALKAIIETRLAAMDEATKLLATNVDKVPYAILQEAGNLKAFIMSRIDEVSHVNGEKFAAVDRTFESNALALTAALAAQEKAVAAQNDSNSLAISKSEDATKETILANAAQAQTGLASLADQFADLKERVVRMESLGVGMQQATTEQRAEKGESHGTVMAIIAGISVLLAIISFIAFNLKK